MNSPAAQAFQRDRLTWLAYAMLAYIGLTQSMLGPIMPFLRSELDLEYTWAGFLSAAMAVGLILSGLLGDGFARRWGRQKVFWSGGLGLAGGAVLLGLSHNFELALGASLAIGLGSSLTQVMIQALLADRHGERRAVALSEANVAASLACTFTPILVGSFQRVGLGWRVFPLLPVIFLTSIVSIFRGQQIPDSTPIQPSSDDKDRRLPAIFWLFWLMLFCVVAVEMIFAVWATDFLANVVGLSQSDAALTFGFFPAAMLAGRIAGSRLSRRYSSDFLLGIALFVTLVGVPLFWLARQPALSLLGLFVTGLGIANLYPLTLSIVVGLAPELSNQASARASLGVGTALLGAPLFLGWLADMLGLRQAFGIGIVFVVLALVILWIHRWLVPPKPLSKDNSPEEEQR
jgi:MFS family permease